MYDILDLGHGEGRGFFGEGSGKLGGVELS